MNFTYFVKRPQKTEVPQPKEVALERLASEGIDYIVDDAETPVTIGHCMKGPEGYAGALIRVPHLDAGNQPVIATYDEAKQVWQRLADGVWLGMDKANRPTPNTLCRKSQVPGHMVQLNDGKLWHIPVARAFPTGSRLPQVMIFNQKTGQLEYSVKQEYMNLYAMGEQVHEQFIGKMAEVANALEAGNGNQQIEMNLCDKDLWLIGKEALKLNYRIDIAEINMLQLFDTQSTLFDVAMAIIDWPSMLAFFRAEKKTT